MFESLNRKDMLNWVEQIQGAIFEGFKCAYTGTGERLQVASLKKFWKESRICEEDFLEMADTGDIILFRS